MKIACKTSDITSELDYNCNPEFRRAILDDPSYIVKKLTFVDPYPNKKHRFILHHPSILNHFDEFDKQTEHGDLQAIIDQSPDTEISEIDIEFVWQI